MFELLKTVIHTIIISFVKEYVKDIYLRIKANKTNKNYTHNLNEYNKEKQDINTILLFIDVIHKKYFCFTTN